VRNFCKFWLYLARFSSFTKIVENAVPFATENFRKFPKVSESFGRMESAPCPAGLPVIRSGPSEHSAGFCRYHQQRDQPKIMM